MAGGCCLHEEDGRDLPRHRHGFRRAGHEHPCTEDYRHETIGSRIVFRTTGRRRQCLADNAVVLKALSKRNAEDKDRVTVHKIDTQARSDLCLACLELVADCDTHQLLGMAAAFHDARREDQFLPVYVERERYCEHPKIEVAPGSFGEDANPQAFINTSLVLEAQCRAVFATLMAEPDENGNLILLVFVVILFRRVRGHRPAYAAQDECGPCPQ